MESAQDCAFTVGDTVVVPRQGVGTVVERGLRRLAGTQQEYLAIDVEVGRMRLLIPTESPGAARLRPLSSRRVAKEALSALGSPPQKLAENWRNRHNEASETLGSGELVAVAGLVRDLAHANQLKRLAGNDHQAYASALELLQSELQAVLEISDGRAAAEIDRRLGLSARTLDAAAKRGSG